MNSFSRFAVALTGAGMLAAGAGCEDSAPNAVPDIRTESAFLDACEQEWIQRDPGASSWARDECLIKWERAVAAAPMAEALLVLRAAADDRTLTSETVPVLLSEAGIPDDVELSVVAEVIHLDWQAPGSEGRYNLIDALRSRGVSLQTLGCPQYPGASMGQEKVMLATVQNRRPFVLTVYSRRAPTGFELALYQVAADFSGVVPGMDALQAGRYPGGGGRAFAVDPTGWLAECSDPE